MKESIVLFASSALRGSRLLQNLTEQEPARDDMMFDESAGETKNSFLTILTVVIGISFLLYIYCSFEICRVCFYRICCGRDISGNRALFIDEGRILELNSEQRRAVLEAIFKEMSKAVTQDEVTVRKKKKNKKTDPKKEIEPTDNDEIVPVDDEVPGGTGSESKKLPSIELGSSSHVDNNFPPPRTPKRSLSFDEGKTTAPASPTITITRSTSLGNLTKKDTDPILRILTIARTSTEEENQIDSSENRIASPANHAGVFPPSPSSCSEDYETPSSAKIFIPMPDDLSGLGALQMPEMDRKLPAQSPNSDQDEKVEEGTQMTAKPKPYPFARVDSQYSANSVSEYTCDEDIEGGMCAICLCGYREGDMRIASKHCSHLFHKECILDWLQNHEACPCCRVEMVTVGELHKAATGLVGKAPLYRYVQMPGDNRTRGAPIAPRSLLPWTPPTSPQQSDLGIPPSFSSFPSYTGSTTSQGRPQGEPSISGLEVPSNASFGRNGLDAAGRP